MKTNMKGAPELRNQISLNGVWDDNQIVPKYSGERFDCKNFSRSVAVPSNWQGKIIRLEFEAVNFQTDVYVNGEFVVNNVGGWCRFTADISRLVKCGEEFFLEVKVKSPAFPPMTNKNNQLQWPIGGGYPSTLCGIVDDVWLRAYERIFIEDVFIIPSVREQKLSAVYTIANLSDKLDSVWIESVVTNCNNQDGLLTLTCEELFLSPGEKKSITITTECNSLDYWWPDNPKLYHFKSLLYAKEHQTCDTETRRFGFREIWIRENYFVLNNVNIKLFGDYQAFADGFYIDPAQQMPDKLYENFKKMKELNMRVLRWHEHPAPRYAFDLSDEMGLMIVCESTLYARTYIYQSDKAEFLSNCKKIIKPWIESYRNHPSIVMWSAENEMGIGGFFWLNTNEIKSLGDEIRKFDTTRPICYDGDGDVGCETVNYHYIEGYNEEPHGDIYSWRKWVHESKPTGIGEYCHPKAGTAVDPTIIEHNRWWLGIWARGLRYVGFADIRPACYWLSFDEKYGKVCELIKNAYAPIALFDKEYDNLGIAPHVYSVLPSLSQGETVIRNLILYNDDYADECIETQIYIEINGRQYCLVMQKHTVELGGKAEFEYVFDVPEEGVLSLDLVLSTYKKGICQFTERKTFAVRSEQGES